MKSLEEGSQYFLRVIESLRMELMKQIMSLSPNQKDEFATLKALLDGLDEPLNRVNVDVQLGKAAWNRMNGVVDLTEGIL